MIWTRRCRPLFIRFPRSVCGVLRQEVAIIPSLDQRYFPPEFLNFAVVIHATFNPRRSGVGHDAALYEAVPC